MLSHGYIKNDFDVHEWAAPEFFEKAAHELLEEEWKKRSIAKLPAAGLTRGGDGAAARVAAAKLNDESRRHVKTVGPAAVDPPHCVAPLMWRPGHPPTGLPHPSA